MEKFTKLGLSKELTDVLKELGFQKPSEIQEKAIPLALAGKDIIGGSATGSGKTLAFSSAIIENLKPNKKIQSLILTPTRELADQVATSIRNFSKNKKLNVLAVYGGVNIEPQIRKLETTDVLVGTPGRVIDHLTRGTLNLENIKFLVLDEVDRMFDMGFIRDVEQILRACSKERQTMLFSATISPDIDHLSKKYTKNPVEISVKSHVDPSKLKQIYYDVPDNKKFSLLVNLLKEENADLVMVFCSTRRNSDIIADNLSRIGIHAKSIHGGIDQKKRTRVLEEFHQKGLGVLVCTDVAARGLDIKGISHVYNYDVPEDPKDYIHRIGRTARAGEEGKAITILASRDYERFRGVLQGKGVNLEQEDLPQLEVYRINMGSVKKNRVSQGNSRGRDFSRGPRRDSGRGQRPSSRFGNNSRPSSRRFGNNRSNNDGRSNSEDKPRKPYNRSNNSRRPNSKGYSKPYTKRFDSDEKPRKYGDRNSSGKYNNRDGPRKYGNRDDSRKFSGDRSRRHDNEEKPRRSSYNNRRSDSRGSGRKNFNRR